MYCGRVKALNLPVAQRTRAAGHGAFGARLTGAGWGGAVLALLPPEREARIVAEVQEVFRQAHGRMPPVWSTRAGGGVRSEK